MKTLFKKQSELASSGVDLPVFCLFSGHQMSLSLFVTDGLNGTCSTSDYLRMHSTGSRREEENLFDQQCTLRGLHRVDQFSRENETGNQC